MPFAPPVTATTFPATFMESPAHRMRLEYVTWVRRQKNLTRLVFIFGAPPARAATLRAGVRRSHHADFATSPRSRASVPVMLIAATAACDVARRQRQARRVR